MVGSPVRIALSTHPVHSCSCSQITLGRLMRLQRARHARRGELAESEDGADAAAELEEVAPRDAALLEVSGRGFRPRPRDGGGNVHGAALPAAVGRDPGTGDKRCMSKETPRPGGRKVAFTRRVNVFMKVSSSCPPGPLCPVRHFGINREPGRGWCHRRRIRGGCSLGQRPRGVSDEDVSVGSVSVRSRRRSACPPAIRRKSSTATGRRSIPRPTASAACSATTRSVPSRPPAATATSTTRRGGRRRTTPARGRI